MQLKSKYILGAVGIGALVAMVSGSANARRSVELPAPAAKTSVPGTKTTTVKTSTAPTPSGATVTTTTTTTSTNAMHGFTDVWTVANIWDKPVSSLVNAFAEGAKLLLVLPDKTYLGTLVGSKGDQLQFMLKLNTGQEIKYWANQDEVKLMSAAQRNTFMQSQGGKFMAPDKLAALAKHFQG